MRTVEFEGKRTYELTPEGREYVEANRDELGDPFAAATGGMDEGVMDLRGLMFQVGAAAMQVAAAGHTDEAKRDPRRDPPRALQDPRRGRARGRHARRLILPTGPARSSPRAGPELGV